MKPALRSLLPRSIALSIILGCTLPAPTAWAQTSNPGDLVVIRDITPRIAYQHVPLSQDPISVSVTTFPADTFIPAVMGLVSDTDLTQTRGSVGVSNKSGLVTTALRNSGLIPTMGSSINKTAVGAIGTAGGIGGSISHTINTALAPLSTVLGSMR